MDNQKPTEGKGSDASRESAGSSIGKSQNSGLSQGSSASGSSQSGTSGSLGSANASPSSAKPATGSSTGAVGGTSNMGSMQSGSSGSSAAGSSGSMSGSTGGNSALGSSGNSAGSTTGSSAGTTVSSSGSMGGASAQSSDMGGNQSQSQGGIKAAMQNVSPDKLHQKIDQVAQGAQPLVDRLVNTAHAGVDRLTGMLSGASETLGQRKGQLGETYQNYSTKSTEYVKTNPGTALLVAAGVGFLLAKLLGSSDTDRRDSRYYRDYRD